MKETEFNRMIVAKFRGLGLFAYKTSDNFQIGLPDIYIASGKWIESKIVKVSGKRPFSIIGEVTEAQKKWAKDLAHGGDDVYLCILVEFPDAKHIAFGRFREMMVNFEMQTTRDTIDWWPVFNEKMLRDFLAERI